MSEVYNLCPRCGNSNIEQTDYEGEGGIEDFDGRRCEECGWEGDIAELVCDYQTTEDEDEDDEN